MQILNNRWLKTGDGKLVDSNRITILDSLKNQNGKWQIVVRFGDATEEFQLEEHTHEAIAKAEFDKLAKVLIE